MDLLLQQKVVLVTGASQGLGKAVATLFAKEGATVFISSRSKEKLEQAKQAIIEETNHHEIYVIPCDMSDAAQIEQLVDTVVNQAGTIDVLINNAGGPPAGKFLDLTDDIWMKSVEQNLLSVVRATRHVLPHMQKQQAGRIVNITSSSIKQSIDNLIVSNTLRPGVYGLTKSLAQEFADENILVNTVGPGKIATDRMTQLLENTAETTGKSFAEVEAEALKEIPLGRLGTPEEFATAVVFLASFANTYITGQQLIVDGASIKAL